MIGNCYNFKNKGSNFHEKKVADKILLSTTFAVSDILLCSVICG